MTAAERISIVTGANSGIGFEIAVGMAEAGYRVIMASRNAGKAEEAKATILRRVPGAALDVMVLDLGDFASVRTFAKDFQERYDHLDVLINNAGILLYSPKANPDGIELQFATNHLGPFLLTALLIDMVPDDPASRVVAMSSVAHKNARIHFDDLTCGGDGLVAYGQSKLACLMFGDELDRRLKAAGRKINALSAHPGGTDSGLFDEMGRLQYWSLKLLSPVFTHSNASAAKPALHAAISPDVRGGDYYGPTGLMELRGRVGPAKRSDSARDPEAAKKLWSLSESLLGHEFRL